MSRLEDDLINDFREQKKFVHEEIVLFDPLAESLRRPAATRLVSKGSLIILEILCYLLFIGVIGFMILLKKVYPFSVLEDAFYNDQVRNNVGIVNVVYLNVALYCVIGFIGVLFLLIGTAVRQIRLKNDIIQVAGKHLKSLVGQLLQRKAAIETIEQRHFAELPSLNHNHEPGVNEIPNYGFEE
jgi:hypothetical protein